LHHIAAENFQIEVSDNYERDVSEDADTGDVLRGLANLPGRCGISA
jgi:hypothetical protein